MPSTISQAPSGGKPDASKLLSDKMLQGWALLETSCPLCNTPLVRNKTRKVLCVCCDLFVMKEAEAANVQPPVTSKQAKATPEVIAPLAMVKGSLKGPLPSLDPPSSPPSLINNLSQSLFNKLQEATSALDSKSVANDASEIKELASMITECVHAIKALRTVLT